MTDRTDPERHPRTWLQRPKAPRACSRCGTSFIPRTPSTRYCSPACREAVEAERQLRKRARERGGGGE
jgi:predicted nucleic acid-binding Zn ribbon protein